VSEEFVVVLPVAFDFEHDALKFGIAAQLVPILVALEPRIIMIPDLNGTFKPGESLFLVA
jgi:hypothetical protein